jgi:hypothetical protein
MQTQSVLARFTSLAILIYCVICWGITIWQVSTSWPIIGPNGSASPMLVVLMALNILLLTVCIPRRRASKSFWSGIVRFRPSTIQAIRRVIRSVEITAGIAVVVFVVMNFVSARFSTRETLHPVMLTVAIILLLLPSAELAALAGAGRDAVQTPPKPDPI